MEDLRNIHFGIVLKRLRKAHRLSQEGLARGSSLNRTYISILERNLKNPSLCTIFALAGALGMKASDLLKEVEDSPEID